ncbi:hypothetical protein KAR91_21735 [Candidatus Pacearchaeota archaeon]|nr:hypothetical protein [Candidatus Pacearchaeota archaeon]
MGKTGLKLFLIGMALLVEMFIGHILVQIKADTMMQILWVILMAVTFALLAIIILKCPPLRTGHSGPGCRPI